MGENLNHWLFKDVGINKEEIKKAIDRFVFTARDEWTLSAWMIYKVRGKEPYKKGTTVPTKHFREFVEKEWAPFAKEMESRYEECYVTVDQWGLPQHLHCPKNIFIEFLEGIK
ncbi:hypothetical protein DRP04_03530 [Archaeoglobales archaeon]|nr:MAG: hypothetical protein DRP04_03530 [Archaeoglobales archaeon]